MIPREPSDTPTEEFVPEFDVRPSSPPVASRLRASEAFTKRPDPRDVGVSLFEGRGGDDTTYLGRRDDVAGTSYAAETEYLGRQEDAADTEYAADIDVPDGDGSGDSEGRPDRRRFALVTSLVAIAAVAGVLAGYIAVQAAGGWDSIWVTSNDGPGMPPTPDSTEPDGDLGQGGSASPSVSGSASESAGASGAPSVTPGNGDEPGDTPTAPGPGPTRPTKTPTADPTPSESPSEPEPSKSKPHGE